MAFVDPFGAHRNAGIPVEGCVWRDESVVGDDLAGVIFNNCRFEQVRFERVNLSQTMFLNSCLQGCLFQDCEWVQTRCIDCTGSEVSIQGGELSEVLLSGARLSSLHIGQSGYQVVLADSEIDRLQFSEAGLRQTVFTLSGCVFSELLAEKAYWSDASVVGLDFSVCSFAGARFERCSFIRSLGRGVDLADISLLSCNLYQSELSEARIRRAEKSIFAECQLVSTNFEEALLDGALFAKSDASNAKFDRARLKGALFPKAVLAGASFEGAHAPRSVWSDADLRDANLARLHAEGATFRNASLAGADVEGACLVETELHGVKETLAGADLRNSRGTVDWRAERESVAHKLPE